MTTVVHGGQANVVVRVRAGDDIAMGEGQFRIERECACGMREVSWDYPASESTTLIYDGECLACTRRRMLALDGSPDCRTCAEPGTFKPSHMGSTRCQSGSLAAGGRNAHCTCDACF